MFLHLVFFQAVSESSSIQRTSGDDFTTSSLFVAYASQKDSGVYKCNPSNTGSASINVHVLDGKFDFLINFWGRWLPSDIRNTDSIRIGYCFLI